MKTIHREVGASRWDVCAARKSSEPYGGGFAQENETLRSEDTIPWQKFAETTGTSYGVG